MSDEQYERLLSEVARLQYLVDWVDENASFHKEVWDTWELLKESTDPWDLVDNESDTHGAKCKLKSERD